MNSLNLIKSLRKKFVDRLLVVELTNTCNLRCPLCSTGSGFNKKQKGMLELDDYKRFMNICAPLFDTISFIGSGEPLLHPQFLEFVEYTAKQMKKTVTCCTNGTLIKDPKAIVKSGLHSIYIDLDGITQVQHQAYRIGSDLEIILDNVRELIRTKGALRSFYPKIYIDTLISKYNEHSYAGLIELAKKLGVNGIRFASMIDDLFRTTDRFPTLERFKHVKRTDAYDCRFKNAIAGILSWDGDLQLCCLTPHHKNPLSKLNVFRESNFLELMDSENFDALTKKAGDYPFCRDCFFRNYVTFEETITFDKSKRHLFRLIATLCKKFKVSG